MNYHDTSALTPGTRIDQYAISDLLGRGGFGITYLVRDEALQRDFALKEYFPEGLVRREDTSLRFVYKPNSEDDYRWGLRKFYDEARLLAQFSHPNIVDVRRVFEANNSAYMLLDFVKGRTLEKWLQGLDSPPTQEELDLISAPLLSALELVHANRTWHLDISPENIMIRSADGAPILLDFGASRFELKQHSQLVSPLILKSGYSAPEQYTSNAERYGPWTDIYAFGAMLYRALSGKRPSEATARQLEDELAPAALLGKGRYRQQFLQAIDWALKIPPRAPPIDRRMAQVLARGRGLGGRAGHDAHPHRPKQSCAWCHSGLAGSIPQRRVGETRLALVGADRRRGRRAWDRRRCHLCPAGAVPQGPGGARRVGEAGEARARTPRAGGEAAGGGTCRIREAGRSQPRSSRRASTDRGRAQTASAKCRSRWQYHSDRIQSQIRRRVSQRVPRKGRMQGF